MREFYEKYPKYKRFEDSIEMRYIFENILATEDNIISMVEACEMDMPPLAQCVTQIEGYCDSIPDCQLDLGSSFTKQVIGSMISFLIKPFGYEPISQKMIPAYCYSKHWENGRVYRKTGKVTKKIDYAIVPTDPEKVVEWTDEKFCEVVGKAISEGKSFKEASEDILWGMFGEDRKHYKQVLMERFM